MAAQLIPRFFKFFPDLSDAAVDSHLDLCEEEELGVCLLTQKKEEIEMKIGVLCGKIIVN